MNKSLERINKIMESIKNEYYKDLGIVNICFENSNINNIMIKVIPYEGIHKNKEYIIKLKFIDDNNWPRIFIDSDIYDKIKTSQYIKNQGKNNSEHKGICIKYLSYGYSFNKYFELYCNEEWTNYIYYLITMFNNLEDFGKGNGIKSNYKEILSIK